MDEPQQPSRTPVGNKLAAAHVGTAVQAGSIGAVHLPSVSAPPVRVPRQLPPDPVGFVNRVVELEALGRLLDGHTRVVVVSGLGGVGKTGLGVHWAHSVSDQFDGGHLYADLNALRHGGGVEVGDVLGGFLRALGVREEWIPAELAERASLYRSIVAHRRVLVLLDNVDQPAQVPPLVPNSAGSMVIVTSRHRLTPLLVSGATLLRLEPLALDEGVRLIGEMLGDTRVADEPEAASELVRLCGQLPIALRVCGARLAGRRHRGIARLSAELADERRRLERLTAEGIPIVEAVFDAAYAGLPEQAAALYRGLGSHPGPEFSLPVVAMIAERDLDGVTDLVETLHNANLLEEIGEDRYRFHDLVRLHARARTGDDREPTRRIVEWYLRYAKGADQAVLGSRLRLADEVLDSELFADPAAALGWLETERTNLVAAVRSAADEQWDELVWQFGEALWALFDNRRHHADELEVARHGVQAARRCDDRPAEARMRNHVVRALLRTGEFARAAEEVTDALDAAAACGHPRIEAAVIESSGFVWLGLGDHNAAIDAFERSKSRNDTYGTRRGTALQGYHLGIALAAAGRHDAAAAELTWAMETMAAESDELSEGKIGIQLGESYRALGRSREAVAVLTRAVVIMAARDMPEREAAALDLLAEVVADPEEADRCRQRAAALRTVATDDD